MSDTVSAIALPHEEAIEFFRQKLNVPTQRWSEMLNQAHAHGFAVAGAASDALLKDFREAVDKAISRGTGLGEFRKNFDAIVKKHGWSHTGAAGWRARVIYETNLATAFSAGRYAQMTESATLAAFPYWEYIHTPVQHPRLMHLAWDGMVLKADDAFWATNYPPNGWGCRCVVGVVSEGGVRRRKLKVSTMGTPATRPWRNPATGETIEVPIGVDPGFAYNPGQAWQEGAAPKVKAPELKPEAPRQVISLDALTPKIVHDFMQKPEGALEVGRLPDDLRQALDAKSESVWLSAETMQKQNGQTATAPGHPEMTAEDYLDIQVLLRAPAVAFVDRLSHVALAGAGSKPLYVVVKTTENRLENYLVTFRRTGRKDLRRLLRRAVRVLKER